MYGKVAYPCGLSLSAKRLKNCPTSSSGDGTRVGAVARTLIGGGGGCIFIYSDSARLASFEINFISKETSRAEPEYMNIHPPPQLINAPAMALTRVLGVKSLKICLTSLSGYPLHLRVAVMWFSSSC